MKELCKYVRMYAHKQQHVRTCIHAVERLLEDTSEIGTPL